MKKYYTLALLITALGQQAFTQVGGNQVYRNNNSGSAPVASNNIYSTDSTLVVRASVLLNKQADHYYMTIGVKEEGETVAGCSRKLNNRIASLMSGLKAIGVKEEESYVDFISQTRIYGHKIEGNTVTEFLEGFEIRKNLIVKLRSLELIGQAIALSAEQGVYDIVKVEYRNDDTEKIYDQLFDEAIGVIEKKKQQFARHSSVRVSDTYRVIKDDFRIYNPQGQYRQYDEAYETSAVDLDYSRNHIKKEVRKDRTFYYEGAQNYVGVDIVLDDISPVVGIQYILELSMIYELEK